MSESDRPSELDSTEILPNSHQTRRIGPYRLLERIGEGGMGEVYVAEQIEPIRRKVALKIIKYGMNTEEVVRRFESERQALAMMDHPCIAKVFDAGATERGRLFFVMEYVEGVPITKHCDTHRLTTTERLVLFQQVCKGVQHAHQKAIIHRDLKPSNVLVTIQNGKAVPKIIDFGVAKAIAQKLTERTLHTQLGQIIGTPEYMSPEQAEMTGQNVDTRTDVYSLGVLLYELLVGTLPFNPRELRKAGFDEIRRKIREDDPLRPSTRITKMGKTSITAAQNRRTNPTKLSSLLRGDLDWITMCALEKDRTRRYGSPADLASDITRYLDNRPVMASPPSVLYRLRKFVKRHNLAVGVAVALMLVLIVFAATMAVQAGRIARERDRALAAEQQARTEANIAEEVSEFLVDLFAVSDPSEARGNNITAREILDRGVARVTETLKDQPDIQARLMETMGSSYTNLALYDQALDLLQDVNLYHRSQHEGDHPDVANSLLLLVSVQIARGEYKQAEEMARQALSMNRRVLGEDHDQTAESLHLLAICFKEQGRFEEAEEAYRQALAIRRRVLGNEHVRTASTLTSLGELLRVKSNFEEAKAMQREALAVAQRAVGDIHPVVRTCIANLALVLQDMEAYDEVEEMQREVLHQDRQLFGIRSPQYATSLSNLAAQLKLQGELVEAESLHREALALRREVLGETHPEVATSLNNLSVTLQAKGELDEAAMLLEEAIAIVRQSMGTNHPHVGISLYNLGKLQLKNGQYREAEVAFRGAKPIMAKLMPADHWRMGNLHNMIGACLTRQHRFAEAESLLVSGYEIICEARGDEDPRTVRALERVIEMYELQGRLKEAETYQSRLPLKKVGD